MKKLHLYLTGALALQTFLAVGLFVNAHGKMDAVEPQPFMAFDKEAVKKVVIRGEDQQVILEKQGFDWQLPELKDLPVNDQKIETILKSVADLDVSWPVATSRSSHQRFEVSEDAFQRSVELYKGDEKVGSFYIGSSPAFKKTYVRGEDSDKVFSVALNTYDFPIKQDEWMDKALLKVEKVEEIRLSDATLVKADEQWTLTEKLKENKVLDESKVSSLVSTIESLRVKSVAPDNIDFAAQDDAFKLTVTAGAKTYEYWLAKVEEEYYIKRQDNPHVFSLTKFSYQKLAETGRDNLLKDIEEEKVGEKDAASLDKALSEPTLNTSQDSP